MRVVARRGAVFAFLLTLGMMFGVAHAKPFAQHAQENARGSGGGPPAIRGPAPGNFGHGGPPADRPGGPPHTPPGCERSQNTTSIEDAFEVALERWLNSAENIYKRQYQNLRSYEDYELDYDVDGNRASGTVDYDVILYDVRIEQDIEAEGTIYVEFAKNGCNWRLTGFDF